MTRLYGRAERGRRVVEAVPGSWKTITMIAAVRSDEAFAPFAFPGAVDAAAFLTYVRRILVPALRPGEVVVMDNLGSHKAPGVAEAIRTAGAQVRYLPPYSPDLSPIEPFWSKIKTHLRSLAARTRDALYAAFGSGLRTVQESDCHGWFQSCGHHIPECKPL